MNQNLPIMISPAMYEELQLTAETQRRGALGRDADRFPRKMFSALRSRGLIGDPNVDGSVSLTEAGWKAVGGR